MKEKWKTSIVDRYEVSNLGRVRHRDTGRIRKQAISTPGYYSITLYVDTTTRKTFSVHVLVAKAFLPPYGQDKEINHIDCNKLNNCVSNLEAITNNENVRHAWRAGLVGTAYRDKRSTLAKKGS